MSPAWIIVIVCLWLVVMGLVVVVAGVLRRVATALESQIPASSDSRRRIGPVNGRRLPPITVSEPSGGTTALSNLPGPFVLAVLTSHCGPCREIADWLRAHPERLHSAARLVVLTDQDGRAAIDLESCATVLTDDESAALGALDVPGTPFVVAVDREGKVVSSSLLGGPDQLLGMLGAADVSESAPTARRIQVVG